MVQEGLILLNSNETEKFDVFKNVTWRECQIRTLGKYFFWDSPHWAFGSFKARKSTNTCHYIEGKPCPYLDLANLPKVLTKSNLFPNSNLALDLAKFPNPDIWANLGQCPDLDILPNSFSFDPTDLGLCSSTQDIVHIIISTVFFQLKFIPKSHSWPWT